MDAEIQFISVSDYLTSKEKGEIDFVNSLKILKDVAGQNEDGNHKAILVDVRNFKSVLSMPEIYEIINELSNHREQFSRKIAVLYGTEFDTEKIQFFEISAQNRGFHINAFSDYDKAVRWLVKPNGS